MEDLDVERVSAAGFILLHFPYPFHLQDLVVRWRVHLLTGISRNLSSDIFIDAQRLNLLCDKIMVELGLSLNVSRNYNRPPFPQPDRR